LIDGLRFRDAATTQGDASSFLSDLLVVNTERLEVLRGSGSSLYGSNAIGGVINVLTDQGAAKRAARSSSKVAIWGFSAGGQKSRAARLPTVSATAAESRI
jgi:outer membrane cobalamin receptor